MKIEKNKVVSIDYTLKGDDGKVIDTSDGRDPLAYIHGVGALIPGLESELEGKGIGDALSVSIPPEKGYGQFDENLVSDFDRSQFENVKDLAVGMQFQVQDEKGQHVFTVTKIDGDKVTMDGNHPLAGATLHFDVEVKEVREATTEELEHGHVH